MLVQLLIVGEAVEFDNGGSVVEGISISSYSILHPCSVTSS